VWQLFLVQAAAAVLAAPEILPLKNTEGKSEVTDDEFSVESYASVGRY